MERKPKNNPNQNLQEEIAKNRGLIEGAKAKGVYTEIERTLEEIVSKQELFLSTQVRMQTIMEELERYAKDATGSDMMIINSLTEEYEQAEKKLHTLTHESENLQRMLDAAIKSESSPEKKN